MIPGLFLTAQTPQRREQNSVGLLPPCVLRSWSVLAFYREQEWSPRARQRDAAGDSSRDLLQGTGTMESRSAGLSG